jgi:hypothetical protein
MTVANEVSVMLNNYDNPHNFSLSLMSGSGMKPRVTTLPYLARITRSSDELSLSDQEQL